MTKFFKFLESLRTENNTSLIETIQQGFSACFEAQSEADLTWEERRDMRRWVDKELRKPGLNPIKYPLNVALPEKKPIPAKPKPQRKGKYSSDPKAREMWLNTIKLYKNKYNWNFVERKFRENFYKKYGKYPSP